MAHVKISLKKEQTTEVADADSSSRKPALAATWTVRVSSAEEADSILAVPRLAPYHGVEHGVGLHPCATTQNYSVASG